MDGDLEFHVICVDPDMYNLFRLYDTFMAEDHHTLSLSIRATSFEHQTNKVSWPVFTWYDGDLEISSAEAEEVFGVKVSVDEYWSRQVMLKTVLTTMHELNTDYGFDPACGGADVCEYFGWPLMEIRDISTGGRKICVCCVYNR